MSNTITINPVSRVEGHGKVTIHLNDSGEVDHSHFHVVEFRGFEKLCEGRLMSEMPIVTTRICGICPVSHHLVSAKACDDLLDVTIPPAAKMLRELMHMGQIVHSHAMHFFHFAAPDFILGPDSDPTSRNVVGLIGVDPELATKAIRLRQIGQNIIQRVGGRAIHPVTAIPGGMSKALSHEDRFITSKELDEGVALADVALGVARGIYEKYAELVPRLAPLRTNYMGTTKDGALELYDGTLRIADPAGATIEEFDGRKYIEHIGERTEDWSYLKFPFYKKLGYPEGTYRVGPLARLNVSERIGTEKANAELASFKALNSGGLVHDTLYYHYARIIELMYAVERARQLVDSDDIVSKEVRVRIDRKAGEGVGVIEAPRGTLIHHYWADDCGKIERANLVVATVHNNPAMDASVNAVAKEFVKGGDIQEGALNMVEMAVRCYDPCLSCATHALGRMPLRVELVSSSGEVISVATKDARA